MYLGLGFLLVEAGRMRFFFATFAAGLRDPLRSKASSPVKRFGGPGGLNLCVVFLKF